MIGEYKGTKTKALFRCKSCGNEWLAKPENILLCRGCPDCGKKRSATKRKYTTDEFIKKVKTPNISIVGEYTGFNEKINCYCQKCDIYFETVAQYLIAGKTCCPSCVKQKLERRTVNSRLTHQEFVMRLRKINPNIIVLGNYVGYKTSILCKCMIDGNEWSPTPSDLLQGKGCPLCGFRRQSEIKRNNPSDFAFRAQKANHSIKMLEDYINQKTPIKVKCVFCGKEWAMLPTNILKGRGCSNCKSSLGEKRIEEFLKENNIPYLTQSKLEGCYYKHSLLFDFFVPQKNICIEFDGRQHFEPIEYFGGQKGFEKTQIRDKIKNDFCAKNNINLLRIPYWEFDNIPNILNKYLQQNL